MFKNAFWMDKLTANHSSAKGAALKCLWHTIQHKKLIE